MRTVQTIITLALFTFVVPIVIVGVSGILISCLHTTARASEPKPVMEANDITFSEKHLASFADAVPAPSDEAPAEEEALVADQPAFDAAEAPTYEIVPAANGRYSSDQLRTDGVIYDDTYRYTWYSQRVLPGGGLSIDGRHVTDEGYVADGQGRIVVASSDLPYGTEVDIPFGNGKGVVLDSGCASGTLDIYTNF